MEDCRTAAKLCEQGDFLAKLDLQNAYFAVSIAPDSRKFLRFAFEGQLYEFAVRPFGLNVAPWIFTKLLRPVLFHLRQTGLRSVAFLDDFLLLGNSFPDCQRNVEKTRRLLEDLGFSINLSKSQLIPASRALFLDQIQFHFDAVRAPGGQTDGRSAQDSRVASGSPGHDPAMGESVRLPQLLLSGFAVWPPLPQSL